MIKVTEDGFVYRILSKEEARVLWNTQEFELYILYSDETDVLIESEQALSEAISDGLDICIEVGTLPVIGIDDGVECFRELVYVVALHLPKENKLFYGSSVEDALLSMWRYVCDHVLGKELEPLRFSVGPRSYLMNNGFHHYFDNGRGSLEEDVLCEEVNLPKRKESEEKVMGDE